MNVREVCKIPRTSIQIMVCAPRLQQEQRESQLQLHAEHGQHQQQQEENPYQQQHHTAKRMQL